MGSLAPCMWSSCAELEPGALCGHGGCGWDKVRLRTGHFPLGTLLWGRRWNCFGACEEREWSGLAVGRSTPEPFPKPQPCLGMINIAQCSPVSPVTADTNHLPTLDSKSSHIPVFLDSGVLEEGSVPTPVFSKCLSENRGCVGIQESLGWAQLWGVPQGKLWKGRGSRRWGIWLWGLQEDGLCWSGDCPH